MNEVINERLNAIGEQCFFTKRNNNYFRIVNDVVQSYSVEERTTGSFKQVIIAFSVTPLCFPYLCSSEFSFGICNLDEIMQPPTFCPFQFVPGEEKECCDKIEDAIKNHLLVWFEQFNSCKLLWENRYELRACRKDALTFAALKLKNYADAQETIQERIRARNASLVHNMGSVSQDTLANLYERLKYNNGLDQVIIDYLQTSSEEEIDDYINNLELSNTRRLYPHYAKTV